MSRLWKDADGLVLFRVSCLSGEGAALLGGSAEAVRGITSRDCQNRGGEPFHAVTADQAWFLRHGPGNIAWHDRVPDGIAVRGLGTGSLRGRDDVGGHRTGFVGVLWLRLAL